MRKSPLPMWLFEIPPPREFEIYEDHLKNSFDAVTCIRQQQKKINAKLSKMTSREMLEYFKKRNSPKTV